jgi:dTDP-glucose 4,6-dehydratase
VLVHVPRQVLITGGAGFIGSQLVRSLLETDPQVHVVTLDALTYAGSRANLADLPAPMRHTFVEGSICDAALVERVLHTCAIDTIVHCAAESHVDRSIATPLAFMETNVLGTCTLLEAARQYWALAPQSCRFLQVSTDEVYGTLGLTAPPFCETTPYAPNSPYAASKAAADHCVRAYHQTYGLPTLITHCSNNYGPRQHPEKFLPTIIGACLRGQPIPLYGDGQQQRDWLYVADHCAALAMILRQGLPGEVYAIGSGVSIWNRDLVALVCAEVAAQTGQPVDVYQQLCQSVPDRLGHDRRYAIDATKLRTRLGWTPRTTLRAGLRQTVAWYLARERAGQS